MKDHNAAGRCEAVGLTTPGPCERPAEYRVLGPDGETLDMCPVCAAVAQERSEADGPSADVLADVRDRQPRPVEAPGLDGQAAVNS